MAETDNMLDSPELDLEGAINELCPQESSLSSLPLLQILLRQRVAECTQRIARLRSELEQTCDGGGNGAQMEGTAEARVAGIQEGIGALLTTLATIRSSSTESQSVVEVITREIRSLDLAKTNIESAVVGLRRFGMLVNAFDQLTRVAKGRRYREAASSLQTVKQLSSHLHSLSTSVPRVAALFKAIQEMQGLLRRTITDEFTAAFEDKMIAPSRSQLTDSCLVIDALGDDARDALIDWYTTFQLREYRRIFSGPSSEAGQLDNIARRYAWFKRLLKTHEEDPNGGGKIFPESWQVGASLCGHFGEVTREDLKSALTRSRATLTVELLLDALQNTTGFEREMTQKFGIPAQNTLWVLKEYRCLLLPYKLQYEKIASRSKSTQVGSAKPIRTAFEAYLGIFVEAQNSTLSDMFVRFRASRPKPADFVKLSSDERPAAVISSSTELFYFYRQTLERCAALSNRTPFLDLCQVYKKWLKVYSEDILSASLSGHSINYINGVGSDRPSLEFGRRSSEGGSRHIQTSLLLCACAVLNTADYCAETAGQLQNRLQDNIHEDFKEQVSLEAEQDLFRANISIAISSLLKELEHACEGGFTSMMRSTWKELDFVTSESAYIEELVAAITIVVNSVKTHLEQKKYVRSFCDKAVGSLVTKFTQAIVRCRPIPLIGAEQIILDLQTLRNCLLTLPQLEPDTPIPSAYTRYVTKSTGKLDTLLKVIMTPEEPAEDFVKHYILLIPCQSFSDFQKVLDLKGVRKNDQNNLLDVFLARTSLQADLDDSSFLSTLDMNPDVPSHASPGGVLQFPGLMSREASRASTPGNSAQQNLTPEQATDAGSRALSDFRRFGQKFSMGLRFSRDQKVAEGS